MDLYLGTWQVPDDDEPVLFCLPADNYTDAERRLNLALANALRGMAEDMEWDPGDTEDGDPLDEFEEVFGRAYIGRLDPAADAEAYRVTTGCQQATLCWPGLEAPADG